jgi:hypothetical protein
MSETRTQQQMPSLLHKALEALTERRGGASELYGVLRDRVQKSSYPGPECLYPNEVEQHVLGTPLSAAQSAHLKECSACSALVEAAEQGDVMGEDRIREELKRLGQEAKMEEVVEVFTETS